MNEQYGDYIENCFPAFKNRNRTPQTLTNTESIHIKLIQWKSWKFFPACAFALMYPSYL